VLTKSHIETLESWRKTIGIGEVLSPKENLEEGTSLSGVKSLLWIHQVSIVLFDLD
jgi:hypothetical protein